MNDAKAKKVDNPMQVSLARDFGFWNPRKHREEAISQKKCADLRCFSIVKVYSAKQSAVSLGLGKGKQEEKQ